MTYPLPEPYGIYSYVPMTQGNAIPIPVTVGCSWNRCLYCDLNHQMAFRALSMDDIRTHIETMQKRYAPLRTKPKNAILMGGNPFCLPTNQLLEIIGHVREAFPYVQTISAFARSDDILRKTRDELIALKDAGMDELSIGVESGNDEVLLFHDKGETVSEQLLAMKQLEDIGMAYSTYIMLGLGGKKWSRAHAIDTGKLLSMVRPHAIIVVTMVVFSDAPLIAKIRSKEFQRISPRQSIEEEILLLEHIENTNTIFNATHKTNALLLKGKLPEQKEWLLEKLRSALALHTEKEWLDIERKKRRRWDKE